MLPEPFGPWLMIEVIAATRMREERFWSESPLGLSLKRLQHDARLKPHIVFANARNLPDIFNARIASPDRSQALVFVHDDVWLDDYFLVDRVIEGLQAFDLIGVAGNRRRLPFQPAWFAVDIAGTWDDASNLSGAVAHGARPFGPVTRYGDCPASCELLDGVFIAVRKAPLADHGILFDPRFDFHFYDLDFCRSARECSLHLGTWPICLTHQSVGAFGSPIWWERYRSYIDKWGS